MGKKEARSRAEIDAWKGETRINVAANRCSCCKQVRMRRECDVRYETKIVVCKDCENLERRLSECFSRAQIFRSWVGSDDRDKCVATCADLGQHLEALARDFREVGRSSFADIKEAAREQMLTHEMGARTAVYVERLLYEALQQFPEFNATSADELAVEYLAQHYDPETVLERSVQRHRLTEGGAV